MSLFPLLGNDIIFGGYGQDTINLNANDGQDIIGYRFASTSQSQAVDGKDTIVNFQRGEDKLLLVDVDLDTDSRITTKEQLYNYIMNTNQIVIGVDDTSSISELQIRFRTPGKSDGLDSGTQTGSSIFLQYLNPLDVSDLMALADTTTIFRDGDKFIGSSLNEAMLDLLFGDDGLDTIQLNDITYNIV